MKSVEACHRPPQLAPFNLPRYPWPMAKSKALSQCLEAQNFAHAALMAIKAKCSQSDGSISIDHVTATAIYRLTAAWERTVERARILRGRPLPGSMRPLRGKRSMPPSTMAEPLFEAHPRQ